MSNTDNAWSSGTSTTKPSTRFATEEPALAAYGVKREKVKPPTSGLSFFDRFSFTADKLSISRKLATDRQWSVGRGRLVIVKGTVALEPIRKMLASEDLHPITCRVKNHPQPRALASIWVNELFDSVCGAYHEYVISFDVHKSRKDVVAFGPGGAHPAYACWYNNFGDDVCEAQFLHTLYINSPLSIAWGREMQAFPKHPEVVGSDLDLDGTTKTCAIRWGNDPILSISTRKRFGLGGFLKESIGLLSHLGSVKVTGFLSQPAFKSHIVMPRKTADRYERPRDYTAHIWKGLHPAAVQLWPWSPTTDHIELGGVTKDSGCEENNGAALLKRAGFEPLGVCGLGALSAVVMQRNPAHPG